MFDVSVTWEAMPNIDIGFLFKNLFLLVCGWLDLQVVFFINPNFSKLRLR